MSRMRMTIAYDGTGFSGFAENLNVRTVAGELKGALATILRQPVNLIVAGRTDAGVHAWGNVVHFDVESEPDVAALQRNLNHMLGPAIAIRSAAMAAPGFHARYSAVARRYRYTVLNRPAPDPFRATTSWHVPQPLDVPAMRLACDPLIGQHDFASFCRVPKRIPDASLVRVVYDARWLDLGDGIVRFDIEASSFCQQMVRAIVGTMVQVGLGQRRAGEVAAILRARDRSVADRVAPARGLCLWEVEYRDEGAPVPRTHWRGRGTGTVDGEPGTTA